MFSVSMLKKIFLFFVLTHCVSVHAQNFPDHVPGQIILCLQPGSTPEFLHTIIPSISGRYEPIAIEEISADQRLWLLKFDTGVFNENNLLRLVRSIPKVKVAQFNHRIRDRKIPNDPQYSKQWQWKNNGIGGGIAGADTRAELVWNVTTGGVTSNGDTIVVAVIDSGIDLNHEDLRDNIWYNRLEIPGNNIDDDANGYIDDFRGWNVQEKNDNTQSSLSNDHGVLVSGVVGAKGNNSKGVTGVNWNVKILTVRANNSSWLLDNSEVNVIAAYAYILKMRKLYNQTNGQKGAFVVATNASWGADEAKPEDSPIWCNFYDTLGHYGILNCGATTNNSINVDIRGDLPTTCPSDYLIAVQASNNSDLNISSGFGKINIDLAAPGVGILSTGIGNNYKTGSGTSFATPMVAGTIGLLYSVPGKLPELSRNYPSEAALLVKKTIMEGVDQIVALQDQNATGGRLNIFKAVNTLSNYTSKCSPPVNVQVNSVSDKVAVLVYDITPETKKVNLYYKTAISSVWTKSTDIKSPFQIAGLQMCQEYQFQLEYFCDSDSVKSPTYNFSTKGCCEIPVLSLETLGNSSVSLIWTDVIGTQRYDLRVQKNGIWDTISVRSNSAIIQGLKSCSVVDVQVRAVCDTSNVQIFAFSSTLRIKTSGCGACVDNSYCVPRGVSSFEWIKEVKINTLSNTSSGSANGYDEFPSKTTTLSRGQQYQLLLSPAYSFSPTSVYFRVWIDYNQDGILDNVNELAFDKMRTVSDTVESGVIAIPWSANTGVTRLRVGMRAILATDSLAPFSPCERGLVKSFFGEFEDYCVTIEPGYTPCPAVNNVSFIISSNSIKLKWDTLSGALGYEVNYKKKAVSDWNRMVVLKSDFIFPAPDCEEYEVRLKTICESDQSEFSKVFTVKSNCTALFEQSENLQIILAPNPFSDHIIAQVNVPEARIIKLELLDIFGRLLNQTQLRIDELGESTFMWKPDVDLDPSLYLVRCTIDNRSTVFKMIKI